MSSHEEFDSLIQEVSSMKQLLQKKIERQRRLRSHLQKWEIKSPNSLIIQQNRKNDLWRAICLLGASNVKNIQKKQIIGKFINNDIDNFGTQGNCPNPDEWIFGTLCF